MVKFQAMVLGAFLFGSLNAQILPINTHAAVQAHGHNGQGNGVVNECVRNVAACKNVPGECRNNGRPAGNNIVTNGCYDGVLGSANNQHGQEHAAKGGYNGVHGRVCQPGNSGNSQVDNSVKPKECVVRPPNGGNCYQPQPPKVCGGRPENSSEKPSKDEKSCNKSNRSKSRKSKSPRKCEKSAEKRLKSGSKCGKSKEKSSNKNNRSKSKNSNSPNKWGKSNEKRLRSASKGHSKEK